VSALPEPARPDPARHRPLALSPELVRAAWSPTSVVVAGAGAGIGVLDHSVVLAVALAGAGWSARMAAAAVRRARRRRAARLRPAQIDPWSLPDPWRDLARQASEAQSRFDQMVGSWPPGPTRDLLVDLQPRVWAQMADLGGVLRRGALAEGWTGAMTSSGRRASSEIGAELGQVQRQKVRYAGTERAAEAERREESLAAELRDARSREAAAQAVRDQLRRALTRLDAAVAGLATAEPAPGGGAPRALTGALDDLSDRLVSLRTALAETAGPPPEA
jgi:hypothetical protein